MWWTEKKKQIGFGVGVVGREKIDDVVHTVDVSETSEGLPAEAREQRIVNVGVVADMDNKSDDYVRDVMEEREDYNDNERKSAVEKSEEKDLAEGAHIKDLAFMPEARYHGAGEEGEGSPFGEAASPAQDDATILMRAPIQKRGVGSAPGSASTAMVGAALAGTVGARSLAPGEVVFATSASNTNGERLSSQGAAQAQMQSQRRPLHAEEAERKRAQVVKGAQEEGGKNRFEMVVVEDKEEHGSVILTTSEKRGAGKEIAANIKPEDATDVGIAVASPSATVPVGNALTASSVDRQTQLSLDTDRSVCS